jgi:hypothetical protein
VTSVSTTWRSTARASVAVRLELPRFRPHWLDLLTLLLSVEASGSESIGDPTSISSPIRLARRDGRAPRRRLGAMAGYYVYSGGLDEIPTSPALRGHQRYYAASRCAGWAAGDAGGRPVLALPGAPGNLARRDRRLRAGLASNQSDEQDEGCRVANIKSQIKRKQAEREAPAAQQVGQVVAEDRCPQVPRGHRVRATSRT